MTGELSPFSDATADTYIGVIRAASHHIDIELFDIWMRTSVCNALSICRIRPLKMRFLPTPPGPRPKPGSLGGIHAFTIDDLGGLLAMHRKGTDAFGIVFRERADGIRRYAEKRVAYERRWAIRHTEEYGLVRIEGASQWLGDSTTPDVYWAALRSTFTSHDGEQVSLNTIRSIWWEAMRAALPDREYQKLAVALR